MQQPTDELMRNVFELLAAEYPNYGVHDKSYVGMSRTAFTTGFSHGVTLHAPTGFRARRRFGDGELTHENAKTSHSTNFSQLLALVVANCHRSAGCGVAFAGQLGGVRPYPLRVTVVAQCRMLLLLVGDELCSNQPVETGWLEHQQSRVSHYPWCWVLGWVPTRSQKRTKVGVARAAPDPTGSEHSAPRTGRRRRPRSPWGSSESRGRSSASPRAPGSLRKRRRSGRGCKH